MRNFFKHMLSVGLVSAGLIFSQAHSAEARIEARVDVASQRMVVKIDGQVYAVWRVSTGRRGYGTPRGVYSVQRMVRMHYSRKYDNSPMPHSVFFRGGFAIHGTNSVRALGRPASHGCVRLSPGNAAALYQLIRERGGARIVIS